MDIPTKWTSPEEARLYNIVEIGIHSSSMLRVFERGSKDRLSVKILEGIRMVSKAQSEEEYQRIHSSLCKWGTKEIRTARRRKDGQVVKRSGPISYGQMAKTVDIAMKIAFYYCSVPNSKLPEKIPPWLNAAVDTAMIAEIKKSHHGRCEDWPSSLELVDEATYKSIQRTIRECIRDNHYGWSFKCTPVQFDDVLWRSLNRRQ